MPRIASTTYVLPQLLAVSATCGLLATVAWVAQGTRNVSAEPVPAIALADASTVTRISQAVTVQQPAPPPTPSNQLLFTFQIGKDTYLKLSDDEPKHGKRVLVDENTVAPVAAADLPVKFRGWGDKTFTLDGGCTATVKDFAVVTRMIGSPGYAGLDDESWTVATAAKAGTSQLAARLDVKGCEKALYARDASLAPIVELEVLERPELVEQATAMLMTTAAADESHTEWTKYGADSPEYRKVSWIEHANVNAMVRRHPTTGQVFVGIHAAVREGCGGPDINVWSLFRVTRDGKLVLMHAERISSLYSIEQMLDVDNDGKLELFGHDWLGLTNVLADAKGEPIDQLTMEFHGCAC